MRMDLVIEYHGRPVVIITTWEIPPSGLQVTAAILYQGLKVPDSSLSYAHRKAMINLGTTKTPFIFE